MNIDFKTFLSVSPNQFGIYLIEKKNQNVLYERELETGNESKTIDFNNLDKFLEENIFNIEKLINQFVKNIFLIIDHEKIINHTIGTKKKILIQNRLAICLLKLRIYLVKIIITIKLCI